MLILLSMVLLHVALLLALRAAMQPAPTTRSVDSARLQITFIERRATSMQPAQPITAPAPQVSPLPQGYVPRADALQAVTVAVPRAPAKFVAPRASLYASDGALLAPAAPTQSLARNVMAHRSASWMLPGEGRVHSPDFHVHGTSPQDVVNTAGRAISGLLANAAHATQYDINGIALTAADRGLRTSGRESDPCEDIALNMVNLEDAGVREEAEQRYEKSCEGH